MPPSINMNNQFYILLVFIFIALSLLAHIFTNNLYDTKRLTQVILITVVFVISYGKLKPNKKLNTIFYTILTIGAVSTALSSNILNSFLHLTHIFLLFGLITLGIYLKEKVNHLFYILFFTNIFLISSSLLNYSFFLLDNSPPNADGILYGFYNIRFFNQFQIICIPIILYFLSDKKLSRIATAALTINILLLLISGARGATISLFIMVALGLYFNLINKEALIKLITCSLFAGIIFYIYISYHSDISAHNYTFRTGSSGRFKMWTDLISKLTLKNILIGYGPGNYFISEMRLSHPHNSILQILYNWGGVVTIIVIATLYNLLKNCIVLIRRSSYDSAFNTCILVTISLLSYSLFSGVIVMPLPQTFLFIFIGLLISYITPTIKQKKRSSKQLILIALSAVFYFGAVLLSYDCLSQASYGPNFWSNGQLSFSQCKLPSNKGN